MCTAEIIQRPATTKDNLWYAHHVVQVDITMNWCEEHKARVRRDNLSHIVIARVPYQCNSHNSRNAETYEQNPVEITVKDLLVRKTTGFFVDDANTAYMMRAQINLSLARFSEYLNNTSQNFNGVNIDIVKL